MVDVNKGHKFFFTKFHRRNFDACRIFYEKPIFALVGKGPKMTLDLEKCDFSANMGIIRPISLIFPKKPYTHWFISRLIGFIRAKNHKKSIRADVFAFKNCLAHRQTTLLTSAHAHGPKQVSNNLF